MIRSLGARRGTLLLLALGAFPASARAPSADRVDPDVEFAAAHHSGPIPFEFVGRHIYVRVCVNESRPLWFLVDTGATASYLDTERATTLGIQSRDAVTGPVTLRLPGVRLRMSALRLMPIRFSGYDGHEVDGLLGYDFFKHFVVAIDYAARSLSLHAPGHAGRGGEARGVPLILLEDDSGGKVPLVSARITQPGRPPIAGRFILDTGARMALVLNTPYVTSHRMLEAVPRTITMIVGGGSTVRDLKLPIGRIEQLEMDGVVVRRPVVGFAQDTTGILTATEFDGVIGGELLRRFRVVFDYPAEAVLLEPSAALAESFEHDMSGMFVIEDAGGRGRLRIHDVLEGSPASQAGLKVGDVILSVDRMPTGRMTLERLRCRFLTDG